MAELTLERVRANFEVLTDWMDRYAYIIDMGKHLAPMAEGLKIEDNLVRGCQSRVWLVAEKDDAGAIQLQADSEAHIVKGLVTLVVLMFSGKTADEIAAVDEKALFDEFGLTQHLSPTRSNGLHSMVKRIRALASA